MMGLIAERQKLPTNPEGSGKKRKPEGTERNLTMLNQQIIADIKQSANQA